jgi:hypothetical protein
VPRESVDAKATNDNDGANETTIARADDASREHASVDEDAFALPASASSSPETSSSEEDVDDDSDVESSVGEDELDESSADASPGEPTRRIAIVNCDWDRCVVVGCTYVIVTCDSRLNSNDLMHVMRSGVPVSVWWWVQCSY